MSVFHVYLYKKIRGKRALARLATSTAVARRRRSSAMRDRIFCADRVQREIAPIR
jgi:hypothetical protein